MSAATSVPWTEVVRAIDSGAADAIRQDIAARALDPCDIVAGYRQLYALRNGEEPDYGVRGLATAYGFLYLVHRAASIAELLQPAIGVSERCRILDLGAGSGASVLALAALRLSDIEVVAVEPSREMRAFPLMRPRPGLMVLEGTYDDVLSGALAVTGAFDAVLLSACFPYGWGGGSSRIPAIQFALNLRPLLKPNGLVLGIEPSAKHWTAAAAGAGLRSADFSVVEGTAGGRDMRLPAPVTTALIEELAPGLRTCPNFDDGVDEMIGPPWMVETAAREPDVTYTALMLPLGASKAASRSSAPTIGSRVARTDPAASPRGPRRRPRRRVYSDGFPAIAVGVCLFAAVGALCALAWWES